MKFKFNPEKENFETIELDMTFSEKRIDTNNDILLQAIKAEVAPDEYEKITTLIDSIQSEIMDLLTKGGAVSRASGKIIVFTQEEKEFISQNENLFNEGGALRFPTSPIWTVLGQMTYLIKEKSNFEGKIGLLEKLEGFKTRSSAHPMAIFSNNKMKISTLEKEALAKRFNDELKKLGYHFHFKPKNPNAKATISIGTALVEGAINAVRTES